MEMKILVGTDSSAGAERTIEFTAKIADVTSSKLTVVHVAPTIPSTKEEIIELIKEELGSPEEAGKKILEGGAAIAKKYTLKFEKKLLKGYPAEELLKESARGKNDLIVVGHSGKGKINEFSLGSVSSKLAYNSKVSVLIAK